MAFIYDYLRHLDVSKLTAGEVSQCLLYLHHISKRNAEVEGESGAIMAKLNTRLAELRKEKNAR
ncbi:hypothetical protein [Pontibacter sp. SGAir0037]|uniref:hypothetical protein n=1 Tax=Pontibacter sp. SGAir0037 TaxID=2571030 RepID=UPI0010CD646B|nr:hypothetical protein [Pontibacter sp. SGAir0037]QCR22754.1 hypothetical protein C1N53_10630 [Pontibacter sp. SGAir0037]